MKLRNADAARLEADYIARVGAALADCEASEVDEIIQSVKEHIEEEVAEAPEGEVSLAQMAGVLEKLGSPDTYADTLTPENEEPKPNTRLVLLLLLCLGVQAAGVWAVIAGVPVFPAVAGFAAVVHFFLVWSRRRAPKWVKGLAGVGAICGLGLIIVEMARAI